MCPLTTNIAAAAALLKKPTHRIMEMIESGEISWALNVAAPEIGRREVRIPTCSILACAEGREFNPQPRDLAKSLFGGSIVENGIPAPRFYTALGITHGHFYNLVRAGAIALSRAPHRGASGAAIIPFSAAVQFLEKRRIS
ncbi:MAG: hypothetical protein N3J91_06990 [Verrucomicrobiae bacterium]|nr:hypothetical protein [Verrucomicrobiae bacterium]